MAYEKVLKHLVQTILGTYNEDGELIGERVYPEPNRAETLYYPFDLRELTDRIEREVSSERLPIRGEVRR